MSVISTHDEDFRVTICYTDAAVVINLSGELDMVTAPELDAVFDAMFDRGHDAVALDLAALRFMDCSGLNVMAKAARRLQTLQGTLTLRSPSKMAQRILDITGLTELFSIELSPLEQTRLGPEQTSGIRHLLDANGGESSPSQFDPSIKMWAERDILDGALRLVVNLARMTIGGADGVSVSLLRDGEISTVASSDQTILEMDAGQYATREGPCLDASLEGRWFHVSSLEQESRWPKFIPVALALGIHAILSNPLLVGQRPVGALNIYSRTGAAFGLAQQELAAAFAVEASVVLSKADIEMTKAAREQRLHQALRSREIIAQAQGVMMERASVGEEAAFDHLRRFSQESARPLRERAEDIVASTRSSEPEVDEISEVTDA